MQTFSTTTPFSSFHFNCSHVWGSMPLCRPHAWYHLFLYCFVLVLKYFYSFALGCGTELALAEHEPDVGVPSSENLFLCVRNKTLMFGFLNLERHSAMEWYKRILLLGLPEPRELNINPKNTIGTVVALNGHRKYYCLYHAKHPEDTRKVGIEGAV